MIYEEVEPFLHIKKAYIEVVDGHLVNEAAYTFYTACKFMKIEIYGFDSNEISELEIDKNTIVYGGVGTMLEVFKKIGVKVPKPLDIPKSLISFTHRDIYYSTIDTILSNAEVKYPIFIKPSDYGKLFNGSIVSCAAEMETFLVYNKTEKRDIPIMVSEIKDFRSEYRVFVLDGKVLDCRKYKGKQCDILPDFLDVLDAIKNYKDAPIAYALDFAIESDGGRSYITSLVEANDAYSLGTYGLDAYDYLRMIMLRWLEITKSAFPSESEVM